MNRSSTVADSGRAAADAGQGASLPAGDGRDGPAAAIRAQARRRLWRRLLVVLLVVLAIGNLLVYLLLVRPAGEREQVRRQAFDELRTGIEQRRQTIARLSGIASNTGEAAREANDFYQQRFLPRDTGFSTIMEEVDKLARANTVRKGTVGYSLGEVAGRPDLNQVEISTIVEGDYGNVMRFINSVERSPMFLIIDTVTVSSSAATPGQPRLVRLTVRLVTFFRS